MGFSPKHEARRTERAGQDTKLSSDNKSSGKRSTKFLRPSKDPDNPESLEPALLEDLSRSGLDSKDAKLLRFAAMSRDETDDFVGEPRASYKIPYFDSGGKEIAYSRVRFLETRKGKFAKTRGAGSSFRYSQPFNSSPHVYLPPYFNWKKILKDPTKRILITEGEKKAAKACKEGICCIALGGVYGFKSQKRLWDLIPEMQEIIWKDREVEICYDADVMLKSEVRMALETLANTLMQEYSPASISFVRLDAEVAGSKTGLDDYLVDRGAEEFDKLPRETFKANDLINKLNDHVCWDKKVLAFFSIESRRYFKNVHHLKEGFANWGDVLVDNGKRAVSIVEQWAKNKNRREVNGVVYKPGEPELTQDNELNLWKPSSLVARKGVPKLWLELVEYIMRKPEYAEWFLKWLAYPIQNPGIKLLQAVFVHGERQGIGKTFTVDPVMEFVYGPENFQRLQNESLTSRFNDYAGRKLFVVTNEVYLPEYRDRRSAMGMLKEMITRETVDTEEKYQPKVKHYDRCNYYLTSNHADALILEKNDRRYFVIEAPNQKLDQKIYDELDEYIREKDGAAHVLHYLNNKVDVSDFNPKADAMRTVYKDSIINLTRDPLESFIEDIARDPVPLFMVNGNLPELELMRAEDILSLFSYRYPKYYSITPHRMARLLKDPRIPKIRGARVKEGDTSLSLYAIFNRDYWRGKGANKWAAHYKQHSKLFGGRGTRAH